MLDQTSGSLHPCFQLLCPHPCSRRDVTLPPEVPGLAPETSQQPHLPGRCPPGPASAGTPGGGALWPVHAKDTNARVLLPCGLPPPQHVTGRGPADPDRPRRARGLGTHPAPALRGRKQESHPAAPNHTRSSNPVRCTSAEIGQRSLTGRARRRAGSGASGASAGGPGRAAGAHRQVPQQRSRKSSSTRTPNLSASTGTRSSTPWNMPKKSSSAGRRRGANPKQRMPRVLNVLASVPPERQ